uniref:Uncharacterized protein n=1 Tax=Tetraselmis sp. GSL018 TaxID=582737 RepID=A0A061SN90_9CHLO
MALPLCCLGSRHPICSTLFDWIAFPRPPVLYRFALSIPSWKCPFSFSIIVDLHFLRCLTFHQGSPPCCVPPLHTDFESLPTSPCASVGCLLSTSVPLLPEGDARNRSALSVGICLIHDGPAYAPWRPFKPAGDNCRIRSRSNVTVFAP